MQKQQTFPIIFNETLERKK